MNDKVVAELLALEEQLDVARARGDIAAFEAVLADDFQTTNPVGAVTNKSDMLGDTRSGKMRVKHSRSDGIVVTPYGDDIAIVRGTAHLDARYRRFNISGAYAYTHVYLRREGTWQVVAAHTSRRMPDWLHLITTRFGSLLRLLPR